MSKLTIRYNDVLEVLELHFKDKKLQEFLSSHVNPKYRTWYKAGKCWNIMPSVLGEVVCYARHLFNHIDASSIPIIYQEVVQEALQGVLDKEKFNYNISKKDISPYSILYITPNAPDFIIKAAYKALAFKYHPDRGGDADKFQEVRSAYEAIKPK